ncbi:hypothetical protein CFOL_v3_20006 [Cephalotus follicularis]|uniref:Protein LNK3 n=1 Tax=Cephalotus follicularis TaxID=3775 RepID=A0A1Q3C8Z8_CEPFO|nr:hypothetical protein CFOL_v3_20006 [Cephalotus follicularis]
MEWYFRSGIDDFVFPKDQDLPDRLPSPKSWSAWGIRLPENFVTHKKCFDGSTSMNWEELNFNGEIFYDEDNVETSIHNIDQCSDTSSCGRISQQTAISWGQPDYQRHDIARIEPMDDIFLNSLLDDVTTAFSPSVSWEEGEISASQYITGNLEQKDFPPVETPLSKSLHPSEQNNLNGPVCEDRSLEESVLQDLEMVMTKLTDETRICFRDAFYRLAKQHSVTQNRALDIEFPPLSWTGHGEKNRFGTEKATELETNTIDRAIANLVFNKIDVKGREIPVEVSMKTKQKAISSRGPTYSSAESIISLIR